jgi:type III secretion protein J
MVMSKDSASKFRFIFFLLLALSILLSLMIGWILWKIYPTLKSKGGFNELWNPIPLLRRKPDAETPDVETQE